MKQIIIYFLVFLLAILIGIAINAHSGYLLVAYGDTTVETTLWVGIIFILLIFIVFYVLLRFGHNCINLPKMISKLVKRYHRFTAQHNFHHAWLMLLLNDWKKAERTLQKVVKHKVSEFLLIGYSSLAYSAQKQGEFKERNLYLDEAQKIYKHDKKTLFAVALCRLHLLLQSNQHEQALALLHHLRGRYPHNKFLVLKLRDVYWQQQDWQNLKKLLPRLRRILAKTEYRQLEKQVNSALWRNFLKTKGQPAKDAYKYWHKLPRYLHYDPEIVAPYAAYLDVNNASSRAEELLLHALRKEWSQDLVAQYGLIISRKPLHQLANAEGWLKAHADDATLLLTLGRICRRQMLWGKAKYYLEQYAKAAPSRVAYHELAELMEQQDDKEMALHYYRQAAKV